MPSSLSSTKQISNARSCERRGDAIDQGLEIARLVARRDHQADDRRGPARLFGSHGQRIGAKRATGSRSSRFGVAAGGGAKPGPRGQRLVATRSAMSRSRSTASGSIARATATYGVTS